MDSSLTDLAMVSPSAARSIILLDKWAGNNLSAAFHARVWPGETGEDGRTGLGDQVAWGVASPPRGSVSGGSGGGGRGFADQFGVDAR